jgi:hypothetical protein
VRPALTLSWSGKQVYIQPHAAETDGETASEDAGVTFAPQNLQTFQLFFRNFHQSKYFFANTFPK